MYLPDKIYKPLKWTAIVALPATGAAYLAVSAVTGLPHGAAVAEVCVILGTFLGTLLGVSSRNWKREHKPDKEGTD